MKKYFTILFCALLFQISHAQWITLNSGTAVSLTQVFFANDSIGYLLGYANGDIFKTIDGGQSWTNPSQTSSCTSIYFTSADTGFACDANYGTGIYKTTDGAASWSHILTTNDYINSFSFPENGNIGYAIGGTRYDSLVIYKTIDRGNSWNKVMVDSILQGSGIVNPNVSFTDSSIGYLIGFVNSDYDNGIFKTTDGGLSWVNQYIDTSFGAYYTVLSICFPAKDTGYAVGFNGTILKTTDGQHWGYLFQSVSSSALTSVWFTSTKRGFAVDATGAIIETLDGGQTWKLDVNTTINFNSIYFPSQNVGYACGSNGQILKYDQPGGIRELTDQNKLSLYPNPSASGKFHLSEGANDQTPKDIFIYDVLGKQVYQNLKTNQSDLNFNISQNAKGVYFVKVVSEGKVSVSRIVFM